MQVIILVGRGWLILWSAVKERCGLHPGRISGWDGITTGMRVGNRSAGGIHRYTTGMMVVSGLPGDVERNTSRFTDFTVGEAKTSFARQRYRGNWGFEGRCGLVLGNWVEICSGVYL